MSLTLLTTSSREYGEKHSHVREAPLSEKVPVTVVTGEFGSGKSTLVRQLVALSQAQGEEVAVVSASLHPSFRAVRLIVSADEEVLERSPGCPCCAIRHDLVRVLRNLSGRRHRPVRVIVETSGVADVATIEQTLMGDAHLRRLVVLDAVLTTVDARRWSARLKLRQLPPRVVEEQVALADVLVVTRPECLSQDGFDTVMKGLEVRNRFARSHLALSGGCAACDLLHVGRTDPRLIAERLEALPPGRIGCSAGGIHTLVLSVPGRLDPTSFDEWIDGLMRRFAQGMLRFHAHVTLAGGEGPAAPVVFRGLRGHLERETEPRPLPSSHGEGTTPVNRLAVMGRGVDLAQLQGSLSGCVVGMRDGRR